MSISRDGCGAMVTLKENRCFRITNMLPLCNALSYLLCFCAMSAPGLMDL